MVNFLPRHRQAAKPLFNDNRGSTGALAVDVHPPTLHINELTRWGVPCEIVVGGNPLVSTTTNEHDQQQGRQCDTEPFKG